MFRIIKNTFVKKKTISKFFKKKFRNFKYFGLGKNFEHNSLSSSKWIQFQKMESHEKNARGMRIIIGAKIMSKIQKSDLIQKR